MILDEIRNIQSTKKDLRTFGLAVGGVLVLIAGLLYWKTRPAWPYFAGIGASLMLLGALLPSVLKPLQKVWMTFAVIMGWVMTRVILTVLFFFVLTSTALIARVFGKHFLETGWKDGSESYWNRRTKNSGDPASSENQF